MVCYSDSEVAIYHPLCEKAAQNALQRISSLYEVLHHRYTGSLEMDFVIRNKETQRYLCVVEVKRTPNAVQSTRYQFQAQSYVQMNLNNNEKNFFVVTNLETLISFKYDSRRTKIYQQMLAPGFERVCSFVNDDEQTIVEKLSDAFERVFRSFINDETEYLAESAPFYEFLNTREPQGNIRKSNLAVLLYEYIRGSFRSINRNDLQYDVRNYRNNVARICLAGNAIDFDGIFAYNEDEFAPVSHVRENVLSGAYGCGMANESGDAVADALFDTETSENRHDGEVPTDPELAILAATLAKMMCGNLPANSLICDPAAGSGNLICAATKVFPNLNPRDLIANDIEPKFRELLSLRLGLKFPNVVCKTNAPVISIKNLVDLKRPFFENVSVILLNPPFVSGVSDKERKALFFRKIRELTGSCAKTEVGQMNLSAVFLETVCRLAKEGTVVVCIYPKAQLTSGGPEGVAFRQMLLDVFGLCAVFNYPSQGLFESVSENTCIFVGKVGVQSSRITAFCANTAVSNLDMSLLQNCKLDQISFDQYETCVPAVEVKNYTIQEMRDTAKSGWKMLSRVKQNAINFVLNNICSNEKLQVVAESTTYRKRGCIGTNGLSDLIYFDSKDSLYSLYERCFQLKNGLRNAKEDRFTLSSGDSLVLDISASDDAAVESAIQDYLALPLQSGKQQRRQKTVEEAKSIMLRYANEESPANCVIIPRATRRKGRVYVSSVPLFVSTNFVILGYENYEEALLLGSYALTVFFQLESEIETKDNDGMRKQEIVNVDRMHFPKLNNLDESQKNRIKNCVRNISFLDLSNPQLRDIDKIWAEILFGDMADNTLAESLQLLVLLVNERNP